MELVSTILTWFGYTILWSMIVACAIVFVYAIWMMYISDWLQYRRAKKVIIPWVEEYRSKCKGNNRFIVTPSDLQDAFREFDYAVICKVYSDLKNMKVIELDPTDGEWCVR